MYNIIYNHTNTIFGFFSDCMRSSYKCCLRFYIFVLFFFLYFLFFIFRFAVLLFLRKFTGARTRYIYVLLIHVSYTIGGWCVLCLYISCKLCGLMPPHTQFLEGNKNKSQKHAVTATINSRSDFSLRVKSHFHKSYFI